MTRTPMISKRVMRLNINSSVIKRGDIWMIDFNPTRGAEINKIRPAVVISSDAVGKLPLKIVVPLTDWKDNFKDNFWHIKIEPDKSNGLEKPSAMDALQVKSISTARFKIKKGRVSIELINEVAAAVAGIIEYN